MELDNKTYDPNIADISEVVETDEHEPNTVIKTLRKGYYIGDDILRPAFVIVAVPSNRNKESNANNLNNN